MIPLEGKIRVLIVDDSAFMRKVIGDLLMEDERIEVVATARNGKDALTKIKQTRPDVVTLDIEMPVMDGLTTLEQIMLHHPLPVIMISNSTQQGAKKTLQAISMGAIDFVTKPSGTISLDIHLLKDEIITKVITASETNIDKLKQQSLSQTQREQLKTYDETIVAIGTSTGGPRALQKIITCFPKDFPASFLIVQHMPKGFTRSLAERLNMLANITVKEAEHNEKIEQGTAYIAPGDYHLKIKQNSQHYIKLTKDRLVNNHRPSVDVLLESFATINGVNKISIILTGMGKDGAVGVKILKQHSPHSIILAEAEQTAVVYGMPKAAIETNCVDRIVPIDEMGSTIEAIVKDMRRV